MQKKIFILEDDEGIREMLQFLLEDQGYLVNSFSTVAAFLDHIKEDRPDLVVLDLWLPDGSGRTVCKQLRANKATEQLPIIIMTANSMIQGVEGADEFIPKPFNINELLERISSFFPKAS